MQFIFFHSVGGEVEYVQKLLNKLDWYQAHKYSIKLPKNINASSDSQSIKKAVQKEFSENKELKTKIKSYIKTYAKEIDYFFSCFDYPVPTKIKVYFTNYGPGGSYRLQDKVIVKITNSPQKIFLTILHETIHLIIEKPFIQKYKLTHWEKEFVVNMLCNCEQLRSAAKDMDKTYIPRKLDVFEQKHIKNLKYKYRNSLKS